MPQTYAKERIPTITTIIKFLSESEVKLRGWSYPHTNKQTMANFGDGRQSSTVYGRYIEAYRAYQSGLFVWDGAYRENDPAFVKEHHERGLSFVNVIYEITEMFLFLKRYYERVSPEAVHVSIELMDIKHRALVSTDFDVFPCRQHYRKGTKSKN
jgi:hypothetical protein